MKEDGGGRRRQVSLTKSRRVQARSLSLFGRRATRFTNARDWAQVAAVLIRVIVMDPQNVEKINSILDADVEIREVFISSTMVKHRTLVMFPRKSKSK